MELIRTHLVPDGILKTRLIEYLLKQNEELIAETPSRNYIKKIIKDGTVFVDGKPAFTGTWICSGQRIELYELDLEPRKIYSLKFPVEFEDDHLAVINKPAGIVVSGNRFRTIENALLFNISISTQNDALVLPRPVHRLDALTSGLLLVAKTRTTRRLLGDLFSQKKVKKIYRAIVIGKIPDEGIIETPINGQPATTHFKLLKHVRSLKCEWLSFLELEPLTGRTHQLRIHLSHLGFPILGDKLYGKNETLFRGKGLFLCAVGLRFTHPVLNKIIDLKINEPDKFKIHRDREMKRWAKYRPSADCTLQE